jgi:hypothetical protein
MRALLGLLSLLLALPALAQQAVVVRTSVKPEQGAVIGQRIALYVDVLFAGEMPRPPRVAIPELPGGQILRFETQATTINDRLDGEPYVGQRFEFALYARRGGKLSVPAPRVSLLDRAGNETGTALGQAVTVEIAVPPGANAGQPLIATTGATMTEQWSPAPKGSFKAGDALVRTVTREAEDMPAMAMPDLAFAAPEGVRVYLDPPQSEDRQDRGVVTGRRIDKATYVFETGGRFTLAGLVQPWWDLQARRLETAKLPAVTLEVAAPPVPPDPWLFIVPLLALLLVLAGERRIEPLVRRRYEARQARWLASEPKAFDDLRRACRDGDPKAVYRAFTAWRQRVDRASGLSSFGEEIESAVLGLDSWSAERSRDLGIRLVAWRQGLHRRRAAAAGALPLLNPAGV